jgi:hypothetical protein
MQKTEADLVTETIDRRFMTTETGQEMVIGIVKGSVILPETTGTNSIIITQAITTQTGEGPVRGTPTTAVQSWTIVQGVSMIVLVALMTDSEVLTEEIARVASMTESDLEGSIGMIVHVVVAKMTETDEVMWTGIGEGLTTGRDETAEAGETMMAAIEGVKAEDMSRCAHAHAHTHEHCCFVSACF